MKALYVALCVLTTVSSAAAQDLVIANARIIVANGTVIDNGSIVVRGGRITSVSAGAPLGTFVVCGRPDRIKSGTGFIVPGIFGEWQSWHPVMPTRYFPRST